VHAHWWSKGSFLETLIGVLPLAGLMLPFRVLSRGAPGGKGGYSPPPPLAPPVGGQAEVGTLSGGARQAAGAAAAAGAGAEQVQEQRATRTREGGFGYAHNTR
jgi:hypothetical protein